MSELQLTAGPRLVRRSWIYDDQKDIGEWVSTDVTDRAFEYLFQELATARCMPWKTMSWHKTACNACLRVSFRSARSSRH